jgi:tRNA A37 methylthiotransferase MiaB
MAATTLHLLRDHGGARRGQSRHLGDVVAEIQGLAAAGYQEAVLTGVHLGSYGHDFGNAAGCAIWCRPF